MTTGTSLFEDRLKEFHPARMDVDLVAMVTFVDERDPLSLVRWNGHEWIDYKIHFYGGATCLAVHDESLYVAKQVRGENTYAFVPVGEGRIIEPRLFPIVAAANTPDGFKYITQSDNLRMMFGMGGSESQDFENYNKKVPQTVIPTPNGFYVCDGRMIRKLFNEKPDIVSHSNTKFAQACLGKMAGDTPVFYARTLIDGADRSDLEFSIASLAPGIRQGGELLCVIEGMGNEGVGQMYAANDGKTLYFSSDEQTTIVRADMRDSHCADAGPVLKLGYGCKIQHFGIFPHGKIK